MFKFGSDLLIIILTLFVIRRFHMNIIVYTKHNCPHCESVKSMLTTAGIGFTERNVQDTQVMDTLKSLLPQVRSVPQVFNGTTHIGGVDALQSFLQTLQSPIATPPTKQIESLNAYLSTIPLEQRIAYINDTYGNSAVLSTSFSIEDQTITHAISAHGKDISVFTLDTGRFFEQTYGTWHATLRALKVSIDAFTPDAHDVQDLIKTIGPNGFYSSIENRKKCCAVRKIAPLKRALAGKKIWITGLRQQQSVTRTNQAIVSYDPTFDIIKVNPLIEWTEDQVWAYIDTHKIPFNPMQKSGFPSVGCAPCTRAVAPGDDIRSGRWWWENPETKECGLHA